MAQTGTASTGPDLAAGVSLADIPATRLLAGHVGGESVLLARAGDAVFAIGAQCTHYGPPLADGLIVGETVRCPWHHACFDLRTGEATAPAFDPLPCWQVEREGDRVFVRGRREIRPERLDQSRAPRTIVIVGGGAAGFAAAEMLRRRGYEGELVMLSAETALPCDRPNLSKDYLAGEAPEDWIPLRGPEFYADNRIDLRLGTEAVRIDTGNRRVVLADGSALPFDRLLLATGCEPVRLSIPGADAPHVHTLRSLDDSRAIIARAKQAKRAVVMGASFIGLEAAAALRTRDLEVHVVAPGGRPMEKVLGPDVGDMIRALHEEHGVAFHLRRTATSIEGGRVLLDDGSALAADLVVVGIGVKPRTALAEASGLAVANGVVVDECLETSVPGIFAAGDIARWPDRRSGEAIRVEHWVVAEQQGQTAALNMLGHQTPFTHVPFFWSRHYDLSIQSVGHAQDWDEAEVDGDLAKRNATVRYRRGGRLLAVATVGREREALVAEAEMEGTAPGGGQKFAAAR